MEPSLRAHGARLARAVRGRSRADIERQPGESPEAAAREARYAAAGERAAAGRSAGHRAASRRSGGDAVAAVVSRRGRRRVWPACRRSPLSVAGCIARPLLAVSRARDRGRRAQGAIDVGRRSVECRHPLLAQLPAPSTDAADPRALARRGQGVGAQRAHMAEAAASAQRTGRARPRRGSPTVRASRSAVLRALAHGAPAQCIARLHRARRRRDARNFAP